MAAVEDVRDQAIEVGRGWSASDAPVSWQLTAGLFRAIAGNERLLERLASLPADRLPALLGAAAIVWLARRDASGPLGSYFPDPGARQPRFDPGFFAAFTAFCAASLDEIMAVCWERRYQMNEVARCSQIACGLAGVIGRFEEPVALVDLGTGAGMALALDRFCYQLGDRVVGPVDSPVRLSCVVRGGRTPPLSRFPQMAERIGIDLDPIDVEDQAAREWLAACVPPEETALARLAAAVEVLRRDPPTIVQGDVVDALPGVLGRLPTGRTVVVVDSYTAVFLAEDRRARLAEVLQEAGRERPVIWLSLDPLVPLGPSGRYSVQGLPVPEDLMADYQQHGVFAVLGVRRFQSHSKGGRLLARGHPSGAWIEWLA